MFRFTNKASSILETSITSGALALVLASGTEGLFPSPTGGDWFTLHLIDTSGNIEIVRCTGRSGTTLTITRGHEGTTARAFTAGARIEHRLTAETLELLQTDNEAAHDALAADIAAQALIIAEKADAYSLDAASLFGTLADARLPQWLKPLRTTTDGATDIDTLVSAGKHAKRFGPSNPHLPLDGFYFYIDVVAQYTDNQNVVQVAWPFGAGEAFFRTSTAGVFSAWKKLMTEAAADAKYVAISTLSEAIDDRVAALVVAGTGIQKTYDDASGALTLSSTQTGSLIAILEDQKASAVQGGTPVAGSWQTRTLNTEVYDPDGLVTLASDAFTVSVDAEVFWSSPFYFTNGCKTRLRCVNNGNVIGVGTTEISRNATPSQVRSIGSAPIDAGLTYRIEYFSNAVTFDAGGLGTASGGTTTEVYTVAIIRKRG